MGGHAWGPMGLAAPRAWGAPWRRSSLRAGRQMGQVGLRAGWPGCPYPMSPSLGICHTLWPARVLPRPLLLPAPNLPLMLPGSSFMPILPPPHFYTTHTTPVTS